MPTWILSLLVALSVTTWSYTKLARLNGNAVPRNNFIAAAGLGLVSFLVVFSLAAMILGF